MKILEKDENGCKILEVSGRLDISNAGDFETASKPFVQNGSRVVLNMSGVEYISSAGLRSILLLAKQLKNVEGRLALAELKGIVREVFELTNCDSIMPVFETTGEAVSGDW